MIRTFDVTRDEHAPTAARHALDALAPQLDEETLEHARLLVTELVTNSVRHGRGEHVRVIVDRRGPDHLRCEVVDDGDGFTPLMRQPSQVGDGGWGLHLVEQLSRNWGVREGSTHVWFELAPRG